MTPKIGPRKVDDWVPIYCEQSLWEFNWSPFVVSCSPFLLMLGSHYRFLSIYSKSHRQKGRSGVDTCLQKLVLENYLHCTWCSKHGKRDA